MTIKRFDYANDAFVNMLRELMVLTDPENANLQNVVTKIVEALKDEPMSDIVMGISLVVAGMDVVGHKPRTYSVPEQFKIYTEVYMRMLQEASREGEEIQNESDRANIN